MTILEAEEYCRSILSNIESALSGDIPIKEDLTEFLSTLDTKVSSYYTTKAKLIRAYGSTFLPNGMSLADAICTVDSLEHRIRILRNVLATLDVDSSLFSSMVTFIREYSELKDSLSGSIRDVSSATQLN